MTEQNGFGKSRLAAITLLLLWAGCSISLISKYDEVIDKGITDFQKKMDLFLIQKQRMPTTSYNDAFYDEIFVDLQVLQTRASSVPKNSQTSGLITILANHVKKVQATDKKGTSTGSTYLVLQQDIDQTCGDALKLELAKKQGD